jgi:hypothetical protein
MMTQANTSPSLTVSSLISIPDQLFEATLATLGLILKAHRKSLTIQI